MGKIISKLFRGRDAPQDRTAGSPFAFYLGSSTSGKYVTERSAMQMTDKLICLSIIIFENHSIVINDEELTRYSKNWHKPAVSKDLAKYDNLEDYEDTKVEALLQPREHR